LILIKEITELRLARRGCEARSRVRPDSDGGGTRQPGQALSPDALEITQVVEMCRPSLILPEFVGQPGGIAVRVEKLVHERAHSIHCLVLGIARMCHRFPRRRLGTFGRAPALAAVWPEIAKAMDSAA
jgi:hypothetical protein